MRTILMSLIALPLDQFHELITALYRAEKINKINKNKVKQVN